MVDSPFLMRLRRSLAVLGILVALVLPGLAATPNIILITLDTTRADRMGFLGSKRGLTPNLDVLAHESVVFLRAYSHVPLTTASHATILTGTYPQYNQVNDFGRPLPESVPYLPEILHRHGYRTGAFVSALVLDPLDGLAPGFDRGFDVYDAGSGCAAAERTGTRRWSGARESWSSTRSHGCSLNASVRFFCGCICTMPTIPTIRRRLSRSATGPLPTTEKLPTRIQPWATC